jgi:hypothetical protein
MKNVENQQGGQPIRGRPMRANLLWSDDQQWAKIKPFIPMNRPARDCHGGEPDDKKLFGGSTYGGDPFQVTPAGRHHARDYARQNARNPSAGTASRAASSPSAASAGSRVSGAFPHATNKLAPNFFPASASSPPWSTRYGRIESGPRLILAYPICTVSGKPRVGSVSRKTFLGRFYVCLRTEDPNLRRGAWRPSSTSRGDVLAYRGGDVGGLVAGSRCKMQRQLVNFSNEAAKSFAASRIWRHMRLGRAS